MSLLRPLIFGALALVGLLLLGVPMLPAAMLAVVPIISGLVSAGIGLTYPLAVLTFAAGMAWTAAPMIMGKEQFDALRGGVTKPG